MGGGGGGGGGSIYSLANYSAVYEEPLNPTSNFSSFVYSLFRFL